MLSDRPNLNGMLLPSIVIYLLFSLMWETAVEKAAQPIPGMGAVSSPNSLSDSVDHSTTKLVPGMNKNNEKLLKESLLKLSFEFSLVTYRNKEFRALLTCKL